MLTMLFGYAQFDSGLKINENKCRNAKRLRIYWRHENEWQIRRVTGQKLFRPGSLLVAPGSSLQKV